MFFVDLSARKDWTVFSQIRAKDHDTLPAVLTRKQVHDLLAHIRLRRYRTPLKLIYCCGLGLSECLACAKNSWPRWYSYSGDTTLGNELAMEGLHEFVHLLRQPGA
jgi:hypothetical protein